MRDNIYLPACWDDDVRMRALFSEVRNRNVNPQDWFDKKTFWSNCVTNWCGDTNNWTFVPQQAIQAFQRKGQVPVALRAVIEAMRKEQKLLTPSEFDQSMANSWVTWGLNTFVKTPLWWAWGTAAQAVYGNPQQQTQSQQDEQMICMQVVKEKSEMVLTRLQGMVDNPVIGSTISLDEMRELCSDIVGSESNLQLAMRYLRRYGRITWQEIDKETIVKFCQRDETTCHPVTEVDVGIVRLKKGLKGLETDIEKLTSSLARLKIEAKYCLDKGNRVQAKSCLKRKRTIEATIQKKQSAADNIESLLERLQEVGSDKMILEAVKTGVASFKQSLAEAGLSIDKVDDTMADVQEAIDEHEEIQHIISSPLVPSNSADPEIGELESELDQILAQAGDRPSPAELSPRLPDVPKDSPQRDRPTSTKMAARLH